MESQCAFHTQRGTQPYNHVLLLGFKKIVNTQAIVLRNKNEISHVFSSFLSRTVFKTLCSLQGDSEVTAGKGEKGMQEGQAPTKADSFLCLLYNGLPTWGFPGWLSSKESACQCRRRGFDLWVSKIPRGKELVATHSSILAWRIPWTEEPGGLHSPWGLKESDLTA